MKTKIKKIDECDGCCYKQTCDHNLEKCCYLINHRCLIRETCVEESL